MDYGPLVILGVGIAIVLGLIVVLRVNAFIALITAAMTVSLLAPGDISQKISRVAAAFGSAAGSIGIVIALAAVIGKCMLDSGAADRIVRMFLKLLGEKHAPVALLGSGFVLAVPVFFDTVFYLLVPLARSLYRKTGKLYLKYLLAIAAGGAITHTLVPPTPGPLMMAANLGFDVGMMIIVGIMVALPAAVVGLIFAGLAGRWMDIPMRRVGSEPEPEPLPDEELPSLWVSLLPVILPVLLISTNTVLSTMADAERAASLREADVTDWPAFTTALRNDAALATPHAAQRMQSLWTENAAEDPEESGDAQEFLAGLEGATPEQRGIWLTQFNDRVLLSKRFYSPEFFQEVELNPVATELAAKDLARLKPAEVERLNRALLDSTYPELVRAHEWQTSRRQLADISALVGNANLALLLSTVIALIVLARQRGLSRGALADVVEQSLMSGGVIILITAGGGAFGAMLKEARVGDTIQQLFEVEGSGSSGLLFILLGFLVATVLKVAQGSSTVAMITGSAMLASIADPALLGYHPAYLATAIGAGSLVGSWMNDSGFWIFAKMGGLTETEALKSWTILLLFLGLASLGATILLARWLPLV